MLICHHCTFKNHRDHEYDSIVVLFPKHKQEIQANLRRLQDLHLATRVLDKFDQQKERISQRALVVKREIDAALEQLHSELDTSGDELKRSLDGQLHKAIAKVLVQRNQVATVMSFQEEMQQQLLTGSPEQVLGRKQQLIRMTQSMASLCETNSYQLPEIDFLFKLDNEAARRCQNLGEVRIYPLPSSIRAVGKGLKSAMVDHKTSFNLTTYPTDIFGDLFSVDSFSCCLSDGSQQSANTITKAEAGHFEVSYTPVSRGSHQLRVQVEDTDIPGSPFTVQVLPPPDMRTTVKKTIVLSYSPYAVAINPQGWFAIDQGGDHITIYDNKGVCLHSLYYRRPRLKNRGMAFADQEGVVVIGEYRVKVVKLAFDGGVLACVTNPAFKKLRCIAVHPSGKMFVTDSKASCVHVLHPDFTYSHSFGNKGEAPGRLKDPFSIALDSEGLVYVADRFSGCIHKFSPEEDFISMFPCKCLAGLYTYIPSMDKYPHFCIDSNDIIYTVYTDNLQVIIAMYNTSGSLLREKKVNKFVLTPVFNGMAIDQSGNLYVCEYTHHWLLIL